MRQSSLVVVANRLPIDDSRGARRGLRMATQPRRPGQRAAPPSAAHPGDLGRLGRRHRPGPRAARRRRRPDAHRRAQPRGPARPLRGLRQRHPLAALPRRRRAAGAPPSLVGGVPAGQPALRRGDRRGGRAAAGWSGCRITTCSWSPACSATLRPDLRIGFFLHVPFPPPELFMQLPRRAELLRGMLGADLVGFQRVQAAHNFAQLVTRVLELPATDRRIGIDDRVVRIGAFPVSIDTAEMGALAARPDVAARARRLRRISATPAGHPQRGPDGLHQGHRAAPQGVQRAARQRRRQGPRHGAGAGRDAEPGTRRRSTRSCVSASSARSAGSTASSAGSASRRSTT